MKYKHWERLPEYLENKLITKNDHPNLPISIYNYSRDCQFESKWDEVTLDARALVLDNDGNVVARSFPKFFNYGENGVSVPSFEHAHIQDKLDGSLGLLFYYADQWILASKGSFTSEQSSKGMEIILSKYNLSKFLKEYTYVGEIIYPQNRIVVDYGELENFIFTSVFHLDSELNWNTALAILHSMDIDRKDIVECETVFDTDTVNRKTLLDESVFNKEGYVFRFHPSNYRIKLKFEEYVRLHRLITGFSNLDIWRCLKSGDDISILLERVPDEFDRWVRSTIEDFKDKYNEIEESAKLEFEKIYVEDQKEFAKIAIEYPPMMRSVLFNLYHGTDSSTFIWRNLRPVYSKPFWQKEIE